MQFNTPSSTASESSQPKYTPDALKFFLEHDKFVMFLLHDGILRIYTGRYTVNARAHPTQDLPSRWGSLSGFAMERVYCLAKARIEQVWMDQTLYDLNDRNEYRRHVMKNAVHYLADLLADEFSYRDLLSRILPPGNLVVLGGVSQDKREYLCWAVLHRAAYRTREEKIRLPNKSTYTWLELRGEVMHDIYTSAHGTLLGIWDTQIKGQTHTSLYDGAIHLWRSTKIGVLDQRIFDNRGSVVGYSERVLTPTPPSSDHGGSPRWTRSGGSDYDPTEGMSL